MQKKRHQLIGLGGTFDHFHKGHAYFIEFAATMGEKLLIGITDEWLSQSKAYPKAIQTYHQRFQGVKQFCADKQIRADLVKLSNPYGPTIDPASRIQALCVTQETVSGGEKINEIRQAAGYRPLPIYVADMIMDETGQELHSDQIRTGVVNRQGVVYLSHFTQDVQVTEEQKNQLRKPLGHIVEEPSETFNDPGIYLVGDATLEKFLTNNWKFDLAVYDQRQQRQSSVSPTIAAVKPNQTVDNPAGLITRQLLDVLQTALSQKNTYVLVNGEEDLATVALILLTPLESVIYYGQPNQGLVEVLVTEQLKDRMFKLLCSR